ncbi:MAG: SLC45 family MFS transporter [Clostridiales bacterium]|nr:SLC45 family MFS transporter [Clostridiales bacterium]
MKLNYKRTILVGFAFMSISAFWQLYDTTIPVMLKNSFQMNDFYAGFIMAIDNVLALFLLPFFGALSDKRNTKIGKRMPFIIGGTIAATILMVVLPIFDQSQNLFWYCVTLGLLLFAMGTYRSPAVALMPDVTPKPLRSKANAIINLMGTVGGLFSLGMIRLLVQNITEDQRNIGVRENYQGVYIAVALFMLLAVLILFITIKERKIGKELAAQGGLQEEELQQAVGEERLSPAVKKSMILILASVFFWFMGYNAVTTSFSKYVMGVWGKGIGDASACLMVATVGATIAFLPVGMLSSKFGRKRMIQFGVTLLALCFGAGSLVGEFSKGLYGLFALVGVAWACINVNSYPMVVELGQGATVGKYTGYYYTFSMAAQIVTPILSGFLLENVGYHTLFPYAAIMVAISFVTISLTKHGDNKPPKPGTLEAFAAGEE